MTRKELRENVFRMLFHKEFHEECEMEEQYIFYKNAVASMSEEDSQYVHDKVFKIIEKLEDIDNAIDARLKAEKKYFGEYAGINKNLF